LTKITDGLERDKVNFRTYPGIDAKNNFFWGQASILQAWVGLGLDMSGSGFLRAWVIVVAYVVKCGSGLGLGLRD
jgi:hypothetical protein